jgi:hypothetical protein
MDMDIPGAEFREISVTIFIVKTKNAAPMKPFLIANAIQQFVLAKSASYMIFFNKCRSIHSL